MTNRTRSTIVNCHRRRSTPRRLRYTAESPPKVPDRPVPRFCNRMAAINATLTMIWPRPRMGFTLRGSSVRYGGRCYHSPRRDPSVAQQRDPRDPGPTGQAGELEEGGRHVGEDAVGEMATHHGPADQDERDWVQRMGGHRRADRVALLVRVTVIGRDGQDRTGSAGIGRLDAFDGVD